MQFSRLKSTKNMGRHRLTRYEFINYHRNSAITGTGKKSFFQERGKEGFTVYALSLFLYIVIYILSSFFNPLPGGALDIPGRNGLRVPSWKCRRAKHRFYKPSEMLCSPWNWGAWGLLSPAGLEYKLLHLLSAVGLWCCVVWVAGFLPWLHVLLVCGK